MQKQSVTLQSRRHGSAGRRSGFSLVELLTVIAIIAILAGIAFPVFGTVRENSRRSQCMSNMRQIVTALKQYQLDNRRYPDYLFGPAQGGKSMQQVATEYSSGASASPGLYPEYLRSLEVYSCPNNTESRTAGDGLTKTVTKRSGPTGAESSVALYTYSAYESNPRVDPATLAYDPGTYMARYSRVWTPLLDTPPADPVARAAYNRQLYWKTPSDDLYVTMCTYHVPRGKVIVAYLNGQTKVLDTAKLKKVAGSGTQDFDMHLLSPND